MDSKKNLKRGNARHQKQAAMREGKMRNKEENAFLDSQIAMQKERENRNTACDIEKNRWFANPNPVFTFLMLPFGTAAE